MRRALLVVAALAVTMLSLVAMAAGQSGQGSNGGNGRAVTYAVIGDTPYGTPQLENFPNDVAEINADPQVSLAIHLGDIKNGSSQCTTSYFEQIRTDFDDFEDPLVYTPGDNEWTDCHRASNGAFWPAGPVLNGDSRPARLGEVRRIFFPNPGWTLGQNPRRVEKQGGGFPENVTWSDAGVRFGVVDVPGSNNDWLPWFEQPRTTSQVAEVTGRTDADLKWLTRIFNEARDEDASAVAIGIQADMWDPAIETESAQYDHFRPIVQRLAQETLRFRRPVLLLNGDSHKFTDDYPLADPARQQNKTNYGIGKDVPNLHRITVNGSTTPCHEWLKLTVDPQVAGVFSYQRILFHKQPGFDPTACPES